jgi:hypothetical protein
MNRHGLLLRFACAVFPLVSLAHACLSLSCAVIGFIAELLVTFRTNQKTYVWISMQTRLQRHCRRVYKRTSGLALGLALCQETVWAKKQGQSLAQRHQRHVNEPGGSYPMSNSKLLPIQLPLQSLVERHCKSGLKQRALMERQQVGKGPLSSMERDL